MGYIKFSVVVYTIYYIVKNILKKKNEKSIFDLLKS